MLTSTSAALSCSLNASSRGASSGLRWATRAPAFSAPKETDRVPGGVRQIEGDRFPGTDAACEQRSGEPVHRPSQLGEADLSAPVFDDCLVGEFGHRAVEEAVYGARLDLERPVQARGIVPDPGVLVARRVHAVLGALPGVCQVARHKSFAVHCWLLAIAGISVVPVAPLAGPVIIRRKLGYLPLTSKHKRAPIQEAPPEG